jgi:hypothetical protein
MANAWPYMSVSFFIASGSGASRRVVSSFLQGGGTAGECLTLSDLIAEIEAD